MSTPELRPDMASDGARSGARDGLGGGGARPVPARPVLARIVAAHGGAGPGRADLTAALKTGLTRAIRRAAMPFAGLMPHLTEVAVIPETTLSAASEMVPGTGLLAAIEDAEGRRGLIALSHRLVDALIEVQATGQVEASDLPPRPVTRIDEALCRDFLDLVLAAFAMETAGAVARDWPDRLGYGSRIDDRSQLTLLLQERGYHLLTVTVTAAGRKSGELVFLLPADPALARRRMVAAPAVARHTPEEWSARMLRALGAAPLALDAVLLRVTMPLGRVRALAAGDLIPFTRADLSGVTLEGEGDHVFARGALGQLGGARAVRFGGAGAGLVGGAAAGRSGGGAGPVAASAPVPAPLPAIGGLDPGAPMGGFDPSAPMGGFDPSAPMGGLDPNAPMGGFDPAALLGGFDPDPSMG